MLKVLMTLFFIGSAGTSYLGFSGGDQTLGYAGLVIAAVFMIVLIMMFVKAIGCIVTVIMILLLLASIAYFGGFISFGSKGKCSGEECAKVVDNAETSGFWTKVLDKLKGKEKAVAEDQTMKVQIKVSGVPSVIDGNTIRVDGMKLHLYGIEAPRNGQLCQDRFGRDYYCGSISVEKLAQMLGQNPVTCTIVGEKNNETYGVCFSGNDDIGAYMVGLGYAFPNPEFGQVYFPYEKNARTRGLGLWDGTKFSAPWDWDEMQKKAASGKTTGGAVVVPAAKKKGGEKGLLWKNFFN